MKKLLLILALLVSVSIAEPVNCKPMPFIKNANGHFVVPECIPPDRTYMTGSIIWGDSWGDHDINSSVIGVVVKAKAADGSWEYFGFTKDDGTFKVELRPDSAFRFSASSGSHWHEYNETLQGVPEGTIYDGEPITQ